MDHQPPLGTVLWHPTLSSAVLPSTTTLTQSSTIIHPVAWVGFLWVNWGQSVPTLPPPPALLSSRQAASSGTNLPCLSHMWHVQWIYHTVTHLTSPGSDRYKGEWWDQSLHDITNSPDNISSEHVIRILFNKALTKDIGTNGNHKRTNL